MMKFWIDYTQKYENISLELLRTSIDEETFNSLFFLLSSSSLVNLIEDLESNIE